MARENPRWGCVRIEGELPEARLHVRPSVKTCCAPHGPSRPPRGDGPSWTEFLRAQAEGIIACDFFTVETAWLRTLYVLVFIEVGSRRIHVTSLDRAPRLDLGHPAGAQPGSRA